MYCNIPDVRRRTPSITDIDVSDSLVTHYIEDAEKIINGTLSKMYTVPFSTAPDIIVILSADISAYLMMRDYPDKVFKEDLTRLEQAYKETLASILAGDITLIGETPLSTGGVYFYQVTGTGERWADQP